MPRHGLALLVALTAACARSSPPRDAAAPPAPKAAAAAAQPVPAAEYVIVVSEDGLRPDVIERTRTPNHFRLAGEGATARRALTIRESDTLPSHASMLSGFLARDHRLWWNSFREKLGYIHVPTIFSVARAHGLSTAMFIGKPKLRHIALPGSVDHLERPGYLCRSVSRKAAAYFVDHNPRLMFVHFSDPDEAGHSHGWMSAEYLDAVRDSDRCLGTLLAAIDASGLADRTLLIVTADHGGHSKVHSGSRREVDREIPWVVRGPGVPRGVILDVDVATVDTAATVLTALKLPLTPHMAGVPVSD
jgi:predicted AlkP superfamily pyrophosphatase or phosphodiesterase